MKPLQRIAYVWRLVAKVIAYASFGSACSLFTVAFPIIFVLSGFRKRQFQYLSRKVNFYFFKLYVFEMKVLGILDVHVNHKERLKDVHSCVVIANHPSLLDVVVLFSQVPNVNCIVKGSLAKTPFVDHVVNTLFIPNSLPFEEQLERAKVGMDNGESLIIFPEGTRTIPDEPLHLKKGAARFAIYANHNVQPIYIGGNEKIGLRKHDKYFSFHPTERYHYNLDILEPIHPSLFKDHPEPAAIQLLTDAMKDVLEEARATDPVRIADIATRAK